MNYKKSSPGAKSQFDQAKINSDTPIRLTIAAALAFPDGSMTASGLRRESARGRLVIERIAGKDYTTLANIERMRELCRVEAKVQDSTCAGPPKHRAQSRVAHPRRATRFRHGMRWKPG